MTRRRTRIIAARRLHDGTAALWRTSTVRRRAAILGGAAITVLKIAPQNHAIMGLAAGAWVVAAWRAGNPSPPLEGADDNKPPTSNERGQKEPAPEVGEGITILNTSAGPATLTDDPHDTARTNITWKKT